MKIEIFEGRKSLGPALLLEDALARYPQYRPKIDMVVSQYEALNGRKPKQHTYHVGDGIYVTISV